ncbi:MAG: hypothetical protein ABIQ11_04840 [Saprospiraceae bacterium]
MYCPKPHPLVILLRNTLIVFLVFMTLDFIFYGLLLKGPMPYHTDLVEKLFYTFLFAVLYGHLYNKASYIWRPNGKEGFIHDGKRVPDTELCDTSGLKVLNGLIFSLLVSGIIITVMLLSKFVISNVYIYLLDGIRGFPEDSGSTGVLVTKVIVSGVAMEYQGRTEDDPRTP